MKDKNYRLMFLLFVCMANLSAQELPFSPDINSPLNDKLMAAFQAKGSDYQPETKNICSAGQPCFINRLILEDSPYLLQHAHNPINWFAWGDEALAKAKKENKPIFLSIGYASCHWCHRMEQESFDNLQIARILNEHFIAIKVDRERRPDIDAFYATAVQYFQGQQGWPMSLFLTPEGKPFFAGGYYSYSEFLQLLETQKNNWKNKQAEMIQQAKQLISDLQPKNINTQPGAKLDEKLRSRAIKDLLGFTDGYYGGFGESQKFPREPWLFLLLDDSYRYENWQNNDAFTALTTSLDYMARGGIYDQLGGGFHRYTTDPYWKIPHFEKMLYNQALLVQLYLSANHIVPDKDYLRVAEQTLNFVLSEMQSPLGGFYAALDADSEGREGHYYLWTKTEFLKALQQYNKTASDAVDLQLAAQIFDVDSYGEVDGETEQSNILYLSQSPAGFAQDLNMPLSHFYASMDKIRHALLAVRNQRIRPERDEKIIMSWNALMIVALARTGRVLDNPQYLSAAIKAAEFIWQQMSDKKKQSWYRVNFKNNNSKPAQLDDYAYFLQALITLFDLTQDKIWLQRAELLSASMLRQLWDTEQGGFFQSPVDKQAPLPVRNKSAFDKILPSANAIAAQMLIRLTRRTGEQKYQKYAQDIFTAFVNEAYQTPSAYSSLHIAAHELRRGERQLPVYGARANLQINAFIEKIKTQKNHKYRLTITLNLKEQWHINAHQPLEAHLIATQIELSDNSQWRLEKIQYPEYDRVKLGFNDKPLALYQGRVKIQAWLKTRVTTAGKKAISRQRNPVIKLSLQACSHDICLLPERFLLFPEIIPTNK